MTRRHIMVAAILLGCSLAKAESPPLQASPDPDAGGHPAPVLRDPFLPVGYEPPSESESQAAAGPADPRENPEAQTEPAPGPLMFTDLSSEDQARVREHLQVSGVLEKGGRFVAIINQKIVQQDDLLEVDLDDRSYRFRIKKIARNRVELSPAKDEAESETIPTSGGAQ